MDPMGTVVYVMVAVGVLLISMVAYAVGTRNNNGPLKHQAVAFLLFGWFGTYAFYRFLSPDVAPRYFEANVAIEADGRGVCAIPMQGLYSRELLVRARAREAGDSSQPIEIQLELKAENGGAVALQSKDRLMPDSGGQWAQLKKEFRPLAEGDHLLVVNTSAKAGTVQVLAEY
jgi:hypothetical protein